jgi:hypothetical protein
MASRNTSNRMVEQLDPGSHRDLPNNSPAVESANARVDILGPFRRANLAINLSAVQLTLGGVDADAPTSLQAHSSGKILAVSYKFSANITAGGATAAQIQASVAPAATQTAAAAGDVTAVASGGTLAQAAVSDESSEVSFNKGDLLGVQLSTSGTFAPTTADLDVYLVVRWAASPGVPA